MHLHGKVRRVVQKTYLVQKRILSCIIEHSEAVHKTSYRQSDTRCVSGGHVRRPFSEYEGREGSY